MAENKKMVINVRAVESQRGRATDVPVPLDLTSLKFLGKLALVVPLLAALAAHLAEPGLLTKDKSKDQ